MVVELTSGEIFSEKGWVLNKDNKVVFIGEEGVEVESGVMQRHKNLLPLEFPLIVTMKDINHEVANATFYSSSEVIFNKVQTDYIFILVSALLKTLALWYIFLLVSRKLLSKPLLGLTKATESFDPNKPDNLILEAGDLDGKKQQFTIKYEDGRRDEFSASPENEIGLLSLHLVEMHAAIRTQLKDLHHLTKELEFQKQALKEHNITLEEKVKARTLKLESALQDLTLLNSELKNSQKQLVQSEKMASLGELVAGVAHEINTPIGIGVTASSYLHEITEDAGKLFTKNQLKKSQLEHYFDDSLEGSRLILNNLNRVAGLVNSFKLVAADQTSDEKREFELTAYIEDVLSSLSPQIKKSSVTVQFVANKKFIINRYPGVFAQILTNFLMNALSHAFEKGMEGEIDIKLEKKENNLLLTFSDNGKGIPENKLSKIFNPFFTTKRGQGGTGLGLHIVYNIVYQNLRGKVNCDSEIGQGTSFYVLIPIKGLGLKEKK